MGYRILVCNDDGIDSEGLSALAERLEEVGEVTVVAPDRERSAAGHALTLHKPLRLQRVGERRYSVNGTPTDCVNLGVNRLLGKRADFVVAGINCGGNLGDDVTYSGTVAAAMEGTLLGIPSIAVSQVGEGDFHFGTAAEFAARLVRLAAAHPLPVGTLLNVNVPNRPAPDVRGVRITVLGRRVFDDASIVENTDPRGKKYYWIGAYPISWMEGENTDDRAIAEGMISITPVKMDLTHHEAVARLRDWEKALYP